MAAVLTPSFPHDILHNSIDAPLFLRMDRRTPPRPSLPSITSLIEDVDKHTEKSPARSPNSEHRRTSAGSHGPQPPTPERLSFAQSPRSNLPPTPPLPGTSSFDFPPRPSNGMDSPMTNGAARLGYLAGSPVNTSRDSHTKPKSSYPPPPESNHWSPTGSPNSSRRPSNERSVNGQEANGNGQSPYPDPSESGSTYSGLSQQRPLPANFPPQVPSPTQTTMPIDPQMSTAPYQHHHHYPQSHGSPYLQSTDRYQCPTCSKAFSRPSSLKIHSYSHTGEKPFKCKYEGCGKEFSVRSNMKRHEKGCHGIETSSAGGNSPKAS